MIIKEKYIELCELSELYQKLWMIFKAYNILQFSEYACKKKRLSSADNIKGELNI